MIIYRWYNKKTGKSYVGQTINPQQRKHNHIYKATVAESDYYFHRSLRKHGVESFDYEVVEEVDEHSLLNERENHWIDHYNSIWPNGYNQQYANSLSEEAIQKMSKTKRLQWQNLSDEEKLRRIEYLKSIASHSQPQSQKEAAREANQCDWLVTHPDGKQETITNLRKWCIDNSLGTNGQSNLTRGKYKGYKAQKI